MHGARQQPVGLDHHQIFNPFFLSTAKYAASIKSTGYRLSPTGCQAAASSLRGLLTDVGRSAGGTAALTY
jgi:hypothetical protein